MQAVIEQACREFSVRLATSSAASPMYTGHAPAPRAARVSVQVPASQAQAEKRLQEFQTSRDPIPACQHILQHSSMEHARFHAALTLRHAALRDWPLLSPDAQAGLLMFIMHHLFGYEHVNEPSNTALSERLRCMLGKIGDYADAVPLLASRREGGSSLSGKQLLATMAVLLKRGWLDMSQQQRHQFFQASAATCSRGSRLSGCKRPPCML